MSHLEEGGDTLGSQGLKPYLSHDDEFSELNSTTPISPQFSRVRSTTFGESSDDMGGFSMQHIDKTVESDISDDEIVQMLLNASNSSDALDTFNEEDMRRLAPVLTVMRFNDGDVVIKKDEKATFAAIVLEGSFLVKVSEGLLFDCLCGETLGEMSYFEGGKRTADVMSNGNAILGILLFEHIDQLKLYEPDLYSRVIQLLTMAAVGRLRNTINSLENYKHEAKKRIGDYEELLLGSASGTVRLQVQQKSLYRVTNNNEKTLVETGEVVGKSMLRDKKLKDKQDEAISVSSPRVQNAAAAEQHSESLFQTRGGKKSTLKPSEKIMKHNNAAVAINACNTIDNLVQQHHGASLPNVQTAKKSISTQQSHLGELKKRLQTIAKVDNEIRGHSQQVLKEQQEVKEHKLEIELQKEALIMQMEQQRSIAEKERKDLKVTIVDQERLITHLQSDSSTLASDVHSQSTTLTLEKQKYQDLEAASKKVFDRMYFKMLRHAAESKYRHEELQQLRQKYNKVEKQQEQALEHFDSLYEKQASDDRRVTGLITQNRSLRSKQTTMSGMYAAFKWKAFNQQKVLFYSTASAFTKLSQGKKRLFQLFSNTRQRADQQLLDLSQHVMTFQVYLHVQDEILVRDQEDALSVKSTTTKLINSFKSKTFMERLALVVDAHERLDGLTMAYINTLVEIAERSKVRLNAAMMDHEQLRTTSAENMNLKAKIRVLEKSLETYTTASSSERSNRDSQLQAFQQEILTHKREQKKVIRDNAYLTQKRDKLVYNVRKYSAQARVFVTQCSWTLQQHDQNLARAEITKVINELRSLGQEEAAKAKQRELDVMPIPEVQLPLTMPIAPVIEVEEDPLEHSNHIHTASHYELPAIKANNRSQGGVTPTMEHQRSQKEPLQILLAPNPNRGTSSTGTSKSYADTSSIVHQSMNTHHTRDLRTTQHTKRKSPYDFKATK